MSARKHPPQKHPPPHAGRTHRSAPTASSSNRFTFSPENICHRMPGGHTGLPLRRHHRILSHFRPKHPPANTRRRMPGGHAGPPLRRHHRILSHFRPKTSARKHPPPHAGRTRRSAPTAASSNRFTFSPGNIRPENIRHRMPGGHTGPPLQRHHRTVSHFRPKTSARKHLPTHAGRTRSSAPTAASSNRFTFSPKLMKGKVFGVCVENFTDERKRSRGQSRPEKRSG